MHHVAMRPTREQVGGKKGLQQTAERPRRVCTLQGDPTAPHICSQPLSGLLCIQQCSGVCSLTR
jgi:hypothetical protein